MINRNVQEVCCNHCPAKKVVDIPENINIRDARIPEGWIMISDASMSIGTKDKLENLVSSVWSESLHFCSVSCMTNYFSRLFEETRAKCQISNGHLVATVVDPSYYDETKVQ